MRKHLTHLGLAQLVEGTEVLVAGRGALTEGALNENSVLPARFSDWRIAPLPLRDWAWKEGWADPALDLALFVGNDAEIVMALRPGPLADPDAPIPRILGKQPEAGAQALHLTTCSPSDAFGAGPVAAILDAAALPGLEDLLAVETDSYSCLFDGDAAEALGSVAPWVAMLSPDSTVLREGLRKKACLLMAAPGGIDPIRKRFRKVSKLRVDDDSWVYFRFWDQTFRDWMFLYPEGPFPPGIFAPGEAMYLPQPDGTWGVATPPDDVTTIPKTDFLPSFTRFAQMQLRRRFVERATAALEDVVGREIPLVEAARHYRDARDAGYVRERALVRFMEASLRLETIGLTPENLSDAPEVVAAQTASDVHKAAALLDAVNRQMDKAI